MSEIKKVFRSRFPGGSIVELDFCLAPNVRVLNTDFKWLPISQIKEGDKLIGFDEHKRTHDGRKFKITTVEKIKKLIKPSVRVITTEGTITCSEDHMFLATENGQCPLHWIMAKNLKVGNHIPKVMEVWETPDNSEVGWMGGFLDGEGYISNSSQIGYGQNADGDNKLVFDKANNILMKYTTNTELRISDTRRCKVVRPAGLRTGWQAVGVFQPVRLKQKLLRTLETGTSIRSKRNRKAIIKSVEFIGEHEVIAVQTDSHTFLAEGLLSHNCQLEIFALAFLANDHVLKDDLLTGKDLHCVSGALLTLRSYEDFFARYKAGEKVIEAARKLAKQLSFQLQYGAGATSMAKKNNISKTQANNFIKAYYDRYKGVKLYHDTLLQQVQSNRKPSGRVTAQGLPAGVSKFKSITGRLYTFYEQDNPYGPPNFSPTQVKNYPVQGFATGDIVPMVLGHVQEKIFKEGLISDVLLVNTVHDSILLDVKKQYLERAIKITKEVMESAPQLLKMYFGIDFDLPLKVGIKYGPNWLEMKDYA